MQLGSLIEALADRFAAADLSYGHGTDNPWDEAVALALGVTGAPDDRAALAREVAPDQCTRIEALAQRRIRERVPLAYLLGRCRYAGRDFLIEPGIVVPRSPIAELVAAGFRPWLRHAPARILDLCCGSGCIGIIAALAFPDAELDLVDVDPAAVDLAQRNVELHGLGGRARVWRSDLFEDLPAARWDLIVSNPPYVDRVDMASLPAEYRHEPVLGLAGGADGLDLVARLLAALSARLAPEGLFVCEVGASAPALLRRWPRVPFLWPDLEHGGEGVFLLTAGDVPS